MANKNEEVHGEPAAEPNQTNVINERLQAAWDNQGVGTKCPFCWFFQTVERCRQEIADTGLNWFRRPVFEDWRRENVDHVCSHCFREGTFIIPTPEEKGVLFTKVCFQCGFEEEVNGWGDPVLIKNQSSQTEASLPGDEKCP